MRKYELIAAVIAFAIFVGCMSLPNILTTNCKTEAIKAGMKAEDVSKICRP